MGGDRSPHGWAHATSPDSTPLRCITLHSSSHHLGHHKWGFFEQGVGDGSVNMFERVLFAHCIQLCGNSSGWGGLQHLHPSHPPIHPTPSLRMFYSRVPRTSSQIYSQSSPLGRVAQQRLCAQVQCLTRMRSWSDGRVTCRCAHPLLLGMDH